jgi:predicted NACHT family NTPase
VQLYEGDRNRRDLLEEVQREVTDRLMQSLQPFTLPLSAEKQPWQVIRPWDAEKKISTQIKTALPAGSDLIEVLDENRRLLILGTPGCGKTTTILQLGRTLAARAVSNLELPVPVILNLPSWKPSKSFTAWCAASLKVKYGLRRDVADAWLAHGDLLLFLDGSDEVSSELQENCIRVINSHLNRTGF